jgi:anti-sigma factor RsiW
MNCRYVQSRLSAYLDMELTGHEHQLIRSHIENCIECSTEFERLRRTKHLLRQLPVVQSSQGPEAVLVRLRAQRAMASQNAVIRVGWRSARW